MHAEKCPVCNGGGQLTPLPDGTSAVPMSQPCHGCDGMGWIAVQFYIPADPRAYWGTLWRHVNL